MRPLLLALASLASVAPSAAQPLSPLAPPRLPGVQVEVDSAMAQAVAGARASLPVFAARLRSPRPGDGGFAVKVAVPLRDGTAEHVWLDRVAIAGDSLRGRLASEPRGVPGWHLGDRVRAPLTAVSDWMFVERGVLRGAYTTRVLLARLPAGERRRAVAAMGVRLD